MVYVLFYRAELLEYEDQVLQKQQMDQEEDERRKLLDWARKHHHLVSTHVQPGIYNSPFQV